MNICRYEPPPSPDYRAFPTWVVDTETGEEYAAWLILYPPHFTPVLPKRLGARQIGVGSKLVPSKATFLVDDSVNANKISTIHCVSEALGPLQLVSGSVENIGIVQV